MYFRKISWGWHILYTFSLRRCYTLFINYKSEKLNLFINSSQFCLFTVIPHSKNRFKTLSILSYIASKEVAKSIASSTIAKQFGIFRRISPIFLCSISDATFSCPVYSKSYFLVKYLLNLLVMVKGSVFCLSLYQPPAYQ